jgi:hypothetical protein
MILWSKRGENGVVLSLSASQPVSFLDIKTIFLG